MDLLNSSDRRFWDENGYVVVPNAVPLGNLISVLDAIAEFTGKDLADEESWYQEPMVHGGMVNMNHNQALWDNRQNPKIHQAFSEIWGDEKLWVTYDRTNMNPPVCEHWNHQGMIHWDLDMSIRPMELCVQGVLYLTDTNENQGGFQCVPKSHHLLMNWLKKTDQRPTVESVIGKMKPVSIPGKAGDLLIWHSGLLHGNGHNTSDRPRYAQYIGMQPEWTVRTAAGVIAANEQTRQSRIRSWQNSPCQRAVADAIGVPEGIVEQWLRQTHEKMDIKVVVDTVIKPPENGLAKVIIQGKQQDLSIVEQIDKNIFRLDRSQAQKIKVPYQNHFNEKAAENMRQVPTPHFTPQLEKKDLDKLPDLLVENQIYGVEEITDLISSEFGLDNHLSPAKLTQLGRRLVGIDAWS